MPDYRKDFLWGAASSAFQCEGYIENDFTNWEKTNRFNKDEKKLFMAGRQTIGKNGPTILIYFQSITSMRTVFLWSGRGWSHHRPSLM